MAVLMCCYTHPLRPPRAPHRCLLAPSFSACLAGSRLTQAPHLLLFSGRVSLSALVEVRPETMNLKERFTLAHGSVLTPGHLPWSVAAQTLMW